MAQCLKFEVWAGLSLSFIVLPNPRFDQLTSPPYPLTAPVMALTYCSTKKE
jgi:hypothetical protein